MTTQHTPTVYDGDSPEMLGVVDDVAIARSRSRVVVAPSRVSVRNTIARRRTAFFHARAALAAGVQS